MSSSRSLRPWPRRCTTPHEYRRWPGPGRRRASCTTRTRTGRLPPLQLVLFSLYEEEPGGRRPVSLAEPPRPQERVQRHTMEHITDLVRCAVTGAGSDSTEFRGDSAVAVRSCGSSTRSSLSEGCFLPHFAAFLALRPHGRECPFFQPSMTKSSWLSRLGGGGSPGV